MSALDPLVVPTWLLRDAVSAESVDWWGTAWRSGSRKTLPELVEASVLDAESASLLWALVERGKSVTIAAPMSGAGKTTLLTALLEAVPSHRPRRIVRGIHDDVARDPPTNDRITMLVNEISPHLPFYCWGPALRSVLERAVAGDQLLATIHARSPKDVFETLAAAPLDLPKDLIAEIGWVAVLKTDGEFSRLAEFVDLRNPRA